MLIKALQTALSDGMLLETEQRLVCLLLQLETDDFCLSSASKSHHHNVCANAGYHSLAVPRHFACYHFTSAPDGSFSRGPPHAPPTAGHRLTALPARERAGPNFEVVQEEDLGLRFPARGGDRSAPGPLRWAVASNCGQGGRQRPGAASSSSPRLPLRRRSTHRAAGREPGGCCLRGGSLQAGAGKGRVARH